MKHATILSLSLLAAAAAHASGAHDYTPLPERGPVAPPAPAHTTPARTTSAPANAAAAAAAASISGAAALSVGGVGIGGAGGQGGQGGSGGTATATGGQGGTASANNRNTNALSNRSSNRNANTSTSGGNTLAGGAVTTGPTTVSVQGNQAGSGDYSSITYRAAAPTAYAPEPKAAGVSCRLFVGLGASSTGGAFSGGVPIGNDQICLADVQVRMMDRINMQRPGTFSSTDYLRSVCAVEGMGASEACRAQAEAQATATPVMMPTVSTAQAQSQYSADTLRLLP